MTLAYVIKRLLLVLPTLFGILLATFILVQFVPGGPVEHILAKIYAQKSGPGQTTIDQHPNDAR